MNHELAPKRSFTSSNAKAEMKEQSGSSLPRSRISNQENGDQIQQKNQMSMEVDFRFNSNDIADDYDSQS